MEKGLILLFLCIVIPAAGLPKDLGVHGNLYPIEEVDLLAYIKEKASGVNPEEMEKRAREELNRSLDMSLNVPEAKEDRVRYVDPSITVGSPVYDHQGQIIAPAGRLNPLEGIRLTKTIVALNESQLHFIPELRQSYKNIIILLTDGNLQRASEKAEQIVYRADVNILQRLGIERVPSIVTQDGIRLKVEEIKIE